MAERAIVVLFRTLTFIEPITAIRLVLVLVDGVSIEGSEAGPLGSKIILVSLGLDVRQVVFDHLLQSVVGWLGPLQRDLIFV